MTSRKRIKKTVDGIKYVLLPEVTVKREECLRKMSEYLTMDREPTWIESTEYFLNKGREMELEEAIKLLKKVLWSIES